MTDDPIKTAEQHGYARGYAAGKRRLTALDAREEIRGRKERFRQDAFLAALTACVAAEGWTQGGKPINDIKGRTALAWDFADEAVKRAAFL